MDTLVQDVRYAFRTLARRPAFTATAVVVLALGLGSVTAGFSIANWLVVRPAPGVRDDGRVVTGWFAQWHEAGMSPRWISYANHADIMRGTAALEGLAGYTREQVGLGVPGTRPY